MLPYTGTVHAALVLLLDVVFRGSTPYPNQYFVPSGVMTTKYSPSLSPLLQQAVNDRICQAGSLPRMRHWLDEVLVRTSSPLCPMKLMKYSFAPDQQKSSRATSSSRHEWKRRSMNPGSKPQPSPTFDTWPLEADVRPSTACEL